MTDLAGLVIRTQSGFYTVQTGQGSFICQVRGRLKKQRLPGDIVAIGDRVTISPTGDHTALIEFVQPRTRSLNRLAPNPAEEYEQVLIANPDQAFFVFACTHPEPSFGMLDRYLVIAEHQHIPAVILVTKVDLLDLEQAQVIFEPYFGLGYDLLFTSIKSGLGLEEAMSRLAGRISVLSGPSGVGKSSLLNRLIPDIHLDTGEIRQMTHKGRHTTVVRELIPIPNGGYIADTPGLKALALWDIRPEEVDGYFREMRDLVPECHYRDCSHMHEPGCAIRRAVKEGRINPRRYESYVKIRNGEE